MSKHKSKKDKKRKGHVEANLTITRKEALEENLEPIKFWDNWLDWRDSYRAWYDDRSRFHKITYKYLPYDVIKNNKKLKILLQRRKLRKNKVDIK
jgi:hypothetical protein